MQVAAKASPPPLEVFRGRLRREVGWQAALSAIETPPSFVSAVVSMAGAHGFNLSAEEVAQAARPDPLGLSRFLDNPPNAAGCPPPPWLPIGVSQGGGQVCVDWAHFGDRRLTESFFEEAVRRAVRRPLNHFAPFRTPLSDLMTNGVEDGLTPNGLIFHMSRCGSTLAAQMLAASSRNVVVSEAPPLDSIVQLSGLQPDLDEDDHARALAAMARALGRRRFGEERFFIKLDSWHTLALPLFRRAFPDTPWVFLYRDPLEVMVSQMLQPGLQTVPGALPDGLYGIDGGEAMPREEYCARVLQRICAGALEGLALGQGLLVNYSELPNALETRILPHFGVTLAADERTAMLAASIQNAKTPQMSFEADAEHKRRQVTPAIEAAVARHLSGVYSDLEFARIAATNGVPEPSTI